MVGVLQMPVLKVNARGHAPHLHGAGDLDAALKAMLVDLPPGAPIVVLVHGYKFSPISGSACPHSHILSLNPQPGCKKAVSWPRHLGFGRGEAAEGLCIAFGWAARGTIWQAWRRAALAGVALADLIERIRVLRPDGVDIVAHSLGARVTLAAVRALPARSVGRVVLMAAADYRGAAHAVLATPAGRTAEFVNITSRENDVFDCLMEWLLPRRGDRALGAGLGRQKPNWLDIQMDCDATRAALADLGYRIPAPARRICHWSAYLRPGLFGLYRDLIRNRHALPLACLRRVLPAEPASRWSRMWPELPKFALSKRLLPRRHPT